MASMLDHEGDCKPFLDYLDKEITIMGVLSAFPAAILAGVVAQLLSKDKLPEGVRSFMAWEPEFILCGSIWLALATYFFYDQRSTLAWYYGNIALASSGSMQTGKRAIEHCDEAWSWEAWAPYWLGFLGLFNAGFAVIIGLVAWRFKEHFGTHYALLCLILAVTLATVVMLKHAFHEFGASEDFPMRVWWRNVTGIPNQ